MLSTIGNDTAQEPEVSSMPCRRLRCGWPQHSREGQDHSGVPDQQGEHHKQAATDDHVMCRAMGKCPQVPSAVNQTPPYIHLKSTSSTQNSYQVACSQADGSLVTSECMPPSSLGFVPFFQPLN